MWSQFVRRRREATRALRTVRLELRKQLVAAHLSRPSSRRPGRLRNLCHTKCVTYVLYRRPYHYRLTVSSPSKTSDSALNCVRRLRYNVCNATIS